MRALLLALLLIGCSTTGDVRESPADPDSTPKSASQAIPAWEQTPPPIAEGPVVPTERVRRGQLANGLEWFVLEDHTLPRLELGWVTRRGAGSEPAHRAGISVLLTSVMQHGAGGRDSLALAQSVEGLGAALSAAAGWDSASVRITGLSEDREQLFELLADVVRRPRIESGEVERARKRQLASLESARDNPGELVGRELARTLYAGHRYGDDISGTPEAVATLDGADLREWHGSLFSPVHSILFAVGDIDAATLQAEAQARFGTWKGEDPPPPTAPVADQTPERRTVVVVDRPDLVQAQVAIAHEGIARSDDVRVPASLMNNVLGGGGFLSRLMGKVRAEEGLAYGIYSGFSLRSQPGPFSIQTATQVDQVGKVVAIVLDEVEAIRSTRPPSAAELDGAKRFNAGRFALGLETSSAIAGSLIDLDVHQLPDDSLDTYRTRVRVVTLDEVAAQAKQRLHPDRVAIVAVGPADKLVPQLEGFGPVEVVKP